MARMSGVGQYGRVPHRPGASVLRKVNKISNPLQAGILEYVAVSRYKGFLKLEEVPKRYTRYGSLLLLGPTFSAHPPAWSAFFSCLTATERTDLYRQIVEAFKDDSLTHIAINAPIAPTKTEHDSEKQNEIRSPLNLQPVYGDFGPANDTYERQPPTQADFDAAYWTQTVQLSNILQVWAPRWTMFSRGNISEKSRILQDGLSKSPFPGLDEAELDQPVSQIDVVDFYVGIGYFAFCYLKRGVARVWGWELNGWSVEGLRRGCIENGWGVRIIHVDEDGSIEDGQALQNLVNEIQQLDGTQQAIRCIVFWGDNKWACKILGEINSCLHSHDRDSFLNIRHCNLGLLPTSENSWHGAVHVINSEKGAWLHVHENVEILDVVPKQQGIEQKLKQIANSTKKGAWLTDGCHVERVKTYAPGIIHCVYDIKIYPSI